MKKDAELLAQNQRVHRRLKAKQKLKKQHKAKLKASPQPIRI
jgi:hypothetical protein